MTTLCPICEKDDRIQKVSSVYDGGKNFGNYSGPATTVMYSGGKVGVGTTMVHGTTVSETSLARKLAPPRRPQKPSYSIWYYISWIFVVFGIFIPLCYLSVNWNSGDFFYFVAASFPCLGLPLIIGIILGIVTIVRGYNQKRKQTQSYPELLERFNKEIEVWNRLYYCHRDDIIFDPLSGDTWDFKRTS